MLFKAFGGLECFVWSSKPCGLGYGPFLPSLRAVLEDNFLGYHLSLVFSSNLEEKMPYGYPKFQRPASWHSTKTYELLYRVANHYRRHTCLDLACICALLLPVEMLTCCLSPCPIFLKLHWKWWWEMIILEKTYLQLRVILWKKRMWVCTFPEGRWMVYQSSYTQQLCQIY